MGTYGAPYLGRRSSVAFIALCGVWTFAVYSVVTYGWNSYWFLTRISCRVCVRAGIVEWQAPLRSETVWVADIESVRALRLLPNMISIRRREGPSLFLLAGKGVADLVAGLVDQRPDLDHRVGAWARWSERGPGRSWWRPGRHYRSMAVSPVAPWPARR